MKTIIAVAAILATLGPLAAEPQNKNREHRDYVYRRQQAGSVQGVPILRRYIGKREIDIYNNGLMFEKDNGVGVLPRR
jgi:hypothetical protein